MTKYGSFLTSLYGATGAVVGSSSLSLLLMLTSSSDTPSMPEPWALLITRPCASTHTL